MELRHLRYFVAVAEELHFARAAGRLHIEQSPSSRAIKELETDLRMQLFEREPRGTHLTWAGEVFLGDVRRVFTAIDQTKSNVQAQDAPQGVSRWREMAFHRKLRGSRGRVW
jgi:DNA-binding transcriptional LysR family regulator